MSKKVKEKIFYLLFGLIPIIDLINGYFLMSSASTIGSTIGQVFRIITLFFLLIIIIEKNSIKDIILMLLCSTYLLIMCLIFYSYHKSVQGLVDDIVYCTKLLLPILIMISLYYAEKHDILKPDFVDNVFNFFIFFVPLTVIIPKILNIGYSAYGLGGGYKGFYFSNNEINILLVVISVISIHKLMEKYSLKNLILALLCLSSLFMIGSKTSIISIILVLLVYLIKNKNIEKFIKNVLIVSFIIIVGIFLLQTIFYQQVEEMVFRYNYYYDILANNNGSFYDFLFSSRNTRLIPAFKKAFGSNPLNILFGIGHFQQFKSGNLSTIMEMDFFDTILWYGGIVALIILIFYLHILYKGIKYIGYNDYILCFILIFLFSLSAGHVWYSALSGSIFGLVGGQILILVRRDKKQLN